MERRAIMTLPPMPAGDIENSQQGLALFAPTNEAVARAGWETSTPQLSHALLYHIVPAAQRVRHSTQSPNEQCTCMGP